jgi:hypothetical protein
MPNDKPDDTTEQPQDAPEQPGNDDTGEDSPDLGDAGQKALQAERSKARSEARLRKKAETELAALKAKLDEKAGASETVDPKAVAEAAKAEVRAEILRDRALDKIEVLASKQFANPTLAAKLLADQTEDFISDGKIDTEAISDALAELLKAEPYLAAAPEKRFKGSGDNGVRTGKGPDVDQLMAEARKKGDVMEQIRLESLKLIPHVQRMHGVPQSK